MQAKKTINILVTDLDYCAVTHLPGINKNFLSDPMIDWAKEKNYQGFYACTHRAANTLWFPAMNFYYSYLQENITWENINWFLQPRNSWKTFTQLWVQDRLWLDISHYSKTSEVINNFSRATELQCFTVSMADDCLYENEHCGYVYEKIVKPLEEKETVKPATVEKKYLSICYILQGFGNTKNPQLIQIAQDIVKKYDDNNTKIIIDFIDDKKKLCNEALKVKSDPNWPPQVDINVFNHYANSQNAKITQVNSTDNLATQSSAKSCSKFGLFSTAVVIAGCCTATYAGYYKPR